MKNKTFLPVVLPVVVPVVAVVVGFFNVLPMTTYGQELFSSVRVIDGDTLDIAGEKHRLLGIDAPEWDQMCERPNGQEWPCGNASTFALYTLIKNKPVQCQGQKLGYYKRHLSVCFVGGIDLNAWMVQNGWAMADAKYGSKYFDLEADAKSAKYGIWTGFVQSPWEWRKQKYAP